MIVVFDASAIVKVLLEEEGSEVARGLWDVAFQRVASELAYPEVMSAFAAAERALRLSPDEGIQARKKFDRRWRELNAVAVDREIAQRAGSFARRGAPLSGADAVHLATAIEASEEGAVLVTWDARLSKAARAAGLAVAP